MSDIINNQQQTIDATPAGTGRTFTQEQVNEIVRDRLVRQKEQLADSSEYKAQYEAVKRELEGIKAEQARAAKEAAVRAYYTDKGIIGKALDIAMRGSGAEIDALELDGGKVKDFAAIDGLISGLFAGLVSVTVTKGADVAHPPISGEHTAEDKLADAFKPKI